MCDTECSWKAGYPVTGRGLGWHEKTPCFCSQIRRWTIEALCTGISWTRALSSLHTLFPAERGAIQSAKVEQRAKYNKNLFTAPWSAMCACVGVFTICLAVSGCKFVFLQIQMWMQFHCRVPWCDAELCLAVCSCGSEYCLGVLQVYSLGSSSLGDTVCVQSFH